MFRFGIIIWKMLSGNVPYRGLVQTHPKSYPQNLEKIIRICWDQDPTKRPDFQSIVRPLESGAISFPGTDVTMLRAFITRVTQGGPQAYDSLDALPEFIDPAVLKGARVSQIVNDFLRGSGAILPLLTALQDQRTFEAVAGGYHIMPHVASKLSTCTDAHVAMYLVSLAAQLFGEPSLAQQFFGTVRSQIHPDVLVSFCTSHIPRLLDCLLVIIQHERRTFGARHLARIIQILLFHRLA